LRRARIPSDDRTAPIQHAADRNGLRHLLADAEARRRAIPEVERWNLPDDRVTRIAEQENRADVLVEFDTKTVIGFARAQTAFLLCGGNLDLNKRRDRRSRRATTLVIHEKEAGA